MAKAATTSAKLAPAMTSILPTGPVFDPSKVRVLREVTLPLLKQQDGVTEYVKITGAIYTGKEIKDTREGAKKMEPAQLMKVINLKVGRAMEMIANTVLKSTLEETYPAKTKGGTDWAYIGRCFAITRNKAADGKRYKVYEVVEIADPTAA